jgi:CHAT domain-containing protein/tetratricopeptide (TPR) repeat protein
MTDAQPSRNHPEALSISRMAALEANQRLSLLLSTPQPFAQLERLGDDVERIAASDPTGAVLAGEMLMACARTLCARGTGCVGDVAPEDHVAASRVLARLRRATTLALAYAGRLEDAILLGETNRTDALHANEPVEAARALLSLMHPLLKVGRTQEAIAAGESAHAEFLSQSRPDMAARADINLGNVRKSMGDSAATLVHLDRAMAHLGGDAALAAHIENTRGEALLSMDRFAEAGAAFSSALEWARKANAEFAIGVIEGNMADLAARSGSLNDALELFARARATIGARGHGARLLLEESDVLLAMGLTSIAAKRLQESIATVDSMGLRFEGLRATLALSRAHAALRDTPEASRLAVDAIRRAAELHDAPSESRAHALHALLLAEQGLHGPARSALHEATARDSNGAPSDVLGRLLIQSELEFREWGPGAALGSARAAAKMAADLGAAPLEADAHVQLARMQRLSGDSTLAVVSAGAAVEASERVRSALGAELLRRAYLGRSEGAHEELVLAHLGLNSETSPARALEAAERGKGRSLVERALAARSERAPRLLPTKSAAPASMPADAELAGIRGRLEVAYRRMAQPWGNAHASAAVRAGHSSGPAAPDELRGTVAQLESELSQREVAAAAAAGDGGFARWETNAREIQRSLESDQALVEFFRARGEWMAFVVTSGGVSVARLACADSALDQALARLGFQVRKALRDARAGRVPAVDGAHGVLDSLGEWLWAPIAQEVRGRRRLIIVPHGQLHAVPFCAVRHCGNALIDNHDVCMLPCAAMLPLLVGERCSQAVAPSGDHPEEAAPLVVGVADDLAPAIADEARSVAGLLGCVPLLDKDATAEVVASRLQSSSLAHLACHGQFFPEAPWSSGLRLADRWLGVRDVYSLTASPRQVVLSACDTGGLDVMAGDELTGLVHAFMARGSRSVIASLWSANDASSSRIMAGLYADTRTLGARRTLTPSSLRAAQLAERSRSPHPALWASFTFTGTHA